MSDKPTQEITRTVDEVYNAADADLALACALRKNGKPVEGQLHIFKVHKRVLAAASTFFESMFETAGPQDCKADGIEGEAPPEVKLEESVEIVRILAGAAYRNMESLDVIADAKDWKFILDIWEAATKYAFPDLRLHCSTSLRYSTASKHASAESELTTSSLCCHISRLCAESVPDEEALVIHTRAALLDDPRLCSAYLQKASRVSPHLYTLEILRQLSPATMSTLVSDI